MVNSSWELTVGSSSMGKPTHTKAVTVARLISVLFVGGRTTLCASPHSDGLGTRGVLSGHLKPLDYGLRACDRDD
jgi:hypothetical protein